MFEENVKIEERNFSNLDQDLFMENVLFCGYLGFVEFLKNSLWNKSILNWQTQQSGCYQVDILKINHNLAPKKRRDTIVGNRCSLHKTSIAIAAISIIQTRRFLDQICVP